MFPLTNSRIKLLNLKNKAIIHVRLIFENSDRWEIRNFRNLANLEDPVVSAQCDQHELPQGLRCREASALLKASKAIQRDHHTTDISTNLLYLARCTVKTDKFHRAPSSWHFHSFAFSWQPVMARYITLGVNHNRVQTRGTYFRS